MTRSPIVSIDSNPVELLPDRVVVDWPLDANGDPKRKLVIKKPKNVSELEGLIFDTSMTLSGQIASGVSLAEVRPIDLRSTDPNDVSRRVESDILAVMDSYTSVSAPVEPEPQPVQQPIVEPKKD